MHRDIKPANLCWMYRAISGHRFRPGPAPGRRRPDDHRRHAGHAPLHDPEQALAKRGYLDHRTDIYSLGATLYELVTLTAGHRWAGSAGSPPQDCPGRADPPRRLHPAIPRELETILLKAMSKEPEARYSTAQEFADDLRRYLENKPIHAKPPTIWDLVVKWSRRHTAIVRADHIAILAVVVLALLVNSILLGRERQRTVHRSCPELAESRSRQARKAVDGVLYAWSRKMARGSA